MNSRFLRFFLSIVALLVFWGRPSFVCGAETSSCIACHKSVGGVPYLEHNFADWEKSIHAHAGISCEACHGGDPQKKEKSQAHAGLKPSTDSQSMVYFTRIPATCGSCHEAEYKAFKKSAHYQELERSGRGPNCVTCHGSMANHVLAPRDLETSCTLCHKRPTQASATLMALSGAGVSLQRLADSLAEAQQKHVEIASQEHQFRTLQDLHRRALEDWHTFKMPQVLKTSQEITRQSKTSINEIRLKEEQQKP